MVSPLCAALLHRSFRCVDAAGNTRAAEERSDVEASLLHAAICAAVSQPPQPPPSAAAAATFRRRSRHLPPPQPPPEVPPPLRLCYRRRT